MNPTDLLNPNVVETIPNGVTTETTLYDLYRKRRSGGWFREVTGASMATIEAELAAEVRYGMENGAATVDAVLARYRLVKVETVTTSEQVPLPCSPPTTVDADGAPLYRDGMGPGDPVRCAND